MEPSAGFSCRQFRVWGGWIVKSFMRIKDSIAFNRKRASRLRKALWLPAASLSLSKEVVGIHDLLTLSLFGDGILRRLLRRVSLAKPISAPLPCGWLRKTKPQFGLHQHPKSRETHLEAGAIRHTTNVLHVFRPVLLPPLLPQELRRYDPQVQSFSLQGEIIWHGLYRSGCSPVHYSVLDP